MIKKKPKKAPQEDELNFLQELSDEDSSVMGFGFGGNKGEFSKPTAAMIALLDVRAKRSKEMKAGFETMKLDKFGNALKVTVPDARREYISSVMALKLLLNPEIKKDEEFKKREAEIEEEAIKLFERFAYREFKYIDGGYDHMGNKVGKFVIDPNKEPYMPAPGMSVKFHNPIKNVLEDGFWDSRTNTYYDELVLIYDDLFAALMDLMEKIGYFAKRPLIK